MFKEDQIVFAEGHGGTTFKIIKLTQKGQFATIQAFNLSKQLLLGVPLVEVPTSILTRHKEDANQAAARIVRETTK
jgi:hypothetical protein